MSQQQTTDTDESTQALFHVSATVSYAYVFISSFELWTLESAHLWSLQILFWIQFRPYIGRAKGCVKSVSMGIIYL